MLIKPEHLIIIMERAKALGLPVDGLTANGEFTYTSPPSAAQKLQIETFLAAYNVNAEDALLDAKAAALAAARTAVQDTQADQAIQSIDAQLTIIASAPVITANTTHGQLLQIVAGLIPIVKSTLQRQRAIIQYLKETT